MTETRILVIAGDLAFGRGLESRLRDLGHVVAGVAPSADAAINLAGSLSLDLAVVDTSHPSVDEGVAAARQIRTHLKVPVILLSNRADKPALGSLADPFPYLVMPFENRELRVHIESAVHQHNAELEIGRLSRLYATLSRLNQSILEVKSPEELFQRSCQAIVECSQFKTAWIGRWDPDTSGLLPIAIAGDDAGSTIGAALYRCIYLQQVMKKQVPCTELRNEVSGGGCLVETGHPGFHACGASPIRLHHRTWGALVVQSAEFALVNDAETALLKQIAMQISFALDLLENDRQGYRAQEELHRSEERYRSLVRASAQIVWTSPAHGDQSGEEMPKWQEFTGQTTEQMAGRGWLDAIHPDDRESTFALWSETVAAGEAAEFETRVRRHDGIFRHMLVRAVPVRDQAGNLVEWVGMNIDVTEKKQAEMELQKARDRLAGEKVYLEQEISSFLGQDLIGCSTGLKTVLHKVAKVAPTSATVLLLGETGTGKELIARAVHRMSLRENMSFIKMNCAAIPSGLLESELFGHERGAFTGAVNRKVGRLELADKGTLFLDEIGEIPLDLQPKLLRVLQDLEFERLGSTQTQRVDFRLIAATNADLPQSVKSKHFRSDLFYRLHVFPIYVPALRERKEDIPLLVEHFVRKFAAKMNKPSIGVTDGTMTALIDWDWPGNIRELENFIERSVILTRGSILEAPLRELLVPVEDERIESDLESKTRAQILRALRETAGQLSGPRGAAARLGLPRTTLQSKLKKMGIDHRHFVS